MKSLLVVFMFILDPSGGYEAVEVATKMYATEQECNEAGRNLPSLIDIPRGVKTLSYCVDEKEFRAPVV